MSLPLMFVLVTMIYLAVRALTQAWVNYRVRLALLEKLENSPEILEEVPQIKELFEKDARLLNESYPVDFIPTGTILVFFGLICVMFDFTFGAGQIAAGVYWGGVICTGIGFIFAILGIFLRFLSTPLKL
ncbi:MAG: hypothetical protein N3G21_00720 [Candidatus Hydrogenedentes bacterium]|nr:hypothetical protein [Candidatus Hydrogenedentota bacterium]